MNFEVFTQAKPVCPIKSSEGKGWYGELHVVIAACSGKLVKDSCEMAIVIPYREGRSHICWIDTRGNTYFDDDSYQRTLRWAPLSVVSDDFLRFFGMERIEFDEGVLS